MGGGKKYTYLEGIEIVSYALKNYNKKIIEFIGAKKNLTNEEIDALMYEFLKINYYTPEIEKNKFKEKLMENYINLL